MICRQSDQIHRPQGSVWFAVCIAATAMFAAANDSAASQKKPVAARPLPGKLVGRVSNRLTGQPVRDAVVAIERTKYPRSLKNRSSSRKWTVRTNQRGEFTVTLTPAERKQSNLYLSTRTSHHEFASQRSGFSRRRIQAALTSGQAKVFADIKLWPGKQIAGTLETPDGKPLANVKITTFMRHAKAARFEIGFGEVYSDKMGRFRIAAATPGNGVFWIYPKGYAPQAHLIGDQRGDRGKFVVQKGVRLKGRVLDARGKPVRNIYIGARRRNGDTEVDEFLNQNAVGNGIVRSTRTDGNGKFELDDLPAGDYSVRAEPSRDELRKPAMHVFLRDTVKLSTKRNSPLTIRALPHVEIRARWVDGRGKPTSGYQFYVFGRLDRRSFFTRSPLPDPKTGEVLVRVPHGLQQARLNIISSSSTAIRTRIRPGASLYRGRYIELGNMDDDLLKVRIIKYDSPTLAVSAVDSAGKAIRDFQLSSDYKRDKNSPKFGIRFATGDVRFVKQPNGKWRSAGMLPDLETTITVKKKGFSAKPQKTTLKEGTKRTITFVLKKKS